MIAVAALLVALPAGYFLRSRLAAQVVHAVAYLWAFVFQTLYLMLDSLDTTTAAPAFEPGEFPLSYGAVALAVFAVGFGLVLLGHRLRAYRLRRADVPVPV